MATGVATAIAAGSVSSSTMGTYDVDGTRELVALGYATDARGNIEAQSDDS